MFFVPTRTDIHPRSSVTIVIKTAVARRYAKALFGLIEMGQVETTRDGYRLVERNCPYYNVAMENASLCDVSVDVLSRLFGVRVEREETFQNGDGRCAFRVFANQPLK